MEDRGMGKGTKEAMLFGTASNCLLKHFSDTQEEPFGTHSVILNHRL